MLSAPMHASLEVSVVNAAGLHARPCHAIVRLALGFQAELRISCGDREVDGKSILELMTLGAGCGEIVRLAARGEDAQALLSCLEELIAGGFEESS